MDRGCFFSGPLRRALRRHGRTTKGIREGLRLRVHHCHEVPTVNIPWATQWVLPALAPATINDLQAVRLCRIKSHDLQALFLPIPLLGQVPDAFERGQPHMHHRSVLRHGQHCSALRSPGTVTPTVSGTVGIMVAWYCSRTCTFSIQNLFSCSCRRPLPACVTAPFWRVVFRCDVVD